MLGGIACFIYLLDMRQIVLESRYHPPCLRPFVFIIIAPNLRYAAPPVKSSGKGGFEAVG